MGIDQRIRVQEKIFLIEKGVVDCREGGGLLGQQPTSTVHFHNFTIP